MADEDEDEDNENTAKSLVTFHERQEVARRGGLDTVVSVGLKVPVELEHSLRPGENGKCVVIVWVKAGCDWAVTIKRMSKMHEPMIVEWVLPIGKIPPLVTPPQ